MCFCNRGVVRVDLELCGKLARGDRAVFTDLYRQHNAAMTRLAASHLRNRASAEEVVQEAWISILRNIGSFEGRGSLAAWMFAIVANSAKTRARRDGKMTSFDETAGTDALASAFDGQGRWKDLPALWEELTPERILADRELLAVVQRAIEALPPTQRAVLTLHTHTGLGPSEICALLDVTQGNMRVLLHRARLTIRAALDEVLR